MTLPDEPKGWRKLQAMAQREKDPQKLASILDKMNDLLDAHEKMTARIMKQRQPEKGDFDVGPSLDLRVCWTKT